GGATTATTTTSTS
nr:Chain C, GLY-GLY-ALA-THR-THR-ALA-THR-THR-THR-THR-SER-THR-SER [Porphyromonas gingivalis W83]